MRRVIAPSAATDLADILQFIARDRPAAALAVVDRPEAASRRIAERPHVGRARPDIGHQLRAHSAGRYLIIYRVEPDRVLIVRHFHGARRLSGPD
ncbi:MAG: type II toxin-antitoxin system RelE/ParE family toxin [Acetobacteraceae bacterium]|nr:type II toxin-antitoxin system RelE/ParE family toxin [Acetobacteraceae bacterium]